MSEKDIRKRHGMWTWEEAQNQHCFDKAVADAIVALFPKQPFTTADMGCGPGWYCKHLADAGFPHVRGFDGTPNKWGIYPYVNFIDLSQPQLFDKFDLVLSLEVGEHIPPEFEDNFIDNLDKATEATLILSWGVPGQGGQGHFNLRENEYVVKKLAEKGLGLNFGKTRVLREAATLGWFKNTLMVFERKCGNPK